MLQSLGVRAGVDMSAGTSMRCGGGEVSSVMVTKSCKRRGSSASVSNPTKRSRLSTPASTSTY